MLAAQIGHRNSGLVLLQNPDDLLFTETAALHSLVLALGQSELQTGIKQKGQRHWQPLSKPSRDNWPFQFIAMNIRQG
ncbi:hypothetical protein NKH95_29610 [Mesorhizobium sp. M0848]|uniref:hypothetical protein n=1 Tax=Mesorhizobium sp. M0848 TaxID=2957012 RepID=UPI0033381756